ncbi:Hypothetical protein R9X50_00469300 [Acrodontium crateriforme]|uniref:Uncharacterized protein n=1 Tax=Acrodontium crateriforme TaxID=150365 RepID=A0AAQ3M5T8_9PEZI|nr:Hypothetical protein R9X50_00469300 [Acrodontium crateriforme]
MLINRTHLSVLLFLGAVAQTYACGGPTTVICYDGSNGSTPQNVSLSDIAFAAEYLRYIGQSNAGTSKAFWTQPADFDCQEWELPTDDDGTVLPLADHNNPRSSSSVLYTDIANAIDGGQGATAAQQAKALIGACGTNGGQIGVTPNTTDPAYTSASYKSSGDIPQGIIVKIVHSPSS